MVCFIRIMIQQNNTYNFALTVEQVNGNLIKLMNINTFNGASHFERFSSAFKWFIVRRK